MRIKRFKARDTKTAIQMVKDELGPEAVILSTRELNDPWTGLGPSVEITAGVGYQPKAQAGPPTVGRRRIETHDEDRKENAAPSSLRLLEGEMAEIKELLLDMTNRSNLSERFRDRKDLVRLVSRSHR